MLSNTAIHNFTIIRTAAEARSLAARLAEEGKSLGFTPTMGALHEGHLTLVGHSLKENDVSVVSIYVNPTQFNNPKDLASYPKRIDQDLKKLQSMGVDYVFLPSDEVLYPEGYRYRVHEEIDAVGLCGSSRPGHFDGVLTVLIKMFNLLNPQKVYMGLKDYQQWKLVRGMCQDLFMDIDVVGVETVRTPEGLALSSRNLNIPEADLPKAYRFAQIFHQNKSLEEIHHQLQELDLTIDYLEERWGRRFVAVYLSGVRLIDNIAIPEAQ